MRTIATALAGAATLSLISASHANAYPISSIHWIWESYIFQGYEGFDSRRWEDADYSEVLFHICEPGTSVTVQMRMDVNNAPDKGYDKKTFTACYGGYGYWSQGEWHDLPDTKNNSSEYFFELTDIAGSDTVSVGDVRVDNTAADD